MSARIIFTNSDHFIITDESTAMELQNAIIGKCADSALSSLHIFYEDGSCKMLFDDIDSGSFEITEDKRLIINMTWITKNLEWDSNSLVTGKGWYITSNGCLIINGLELYRQPN